MAEENFLGVFGHVAMDVICSVGHFPAPNTCESVIDRRTAFGGTGGNLAVRAGALGVPTALASYVGQDFPTDYKVFLASKGVDLTDLQTIEGERTCTIIMVSDKDHDQIGFVDQGVMQKQDELPLLEHTIVTSKYVHIGTGRPGYALKAGRFAKSLGKKIAFDPAQEIHYVYEAESFSKVIAEASIFFCNESELKVALMYLGLASIEDLLDEVEMVVHTQGTKGSRILTSKGEDHRIPTCSADKIVDTTGAGDAYRAGFYAGLSRNFDLRRCGIIASASASFAVEGFGGQSSIPNWRDVEERISRRRND